MTAAVLAPASEAELSLTLAELHGAGVPVACEGNGTKRHHGPAVSPDARRISVRQLAAVTAYSPGDMVVVAQAGLPLVELQRQLNVHGQWLPIDPPYADATLGGVLATASAGPRRLGYGTIKDYVLGMRSAGATGVITCSGGRVVKNVTGYDLHRLHVGAFGTLGVLVEVNLRVVPRPELSGAVVLGFPSTERAHQHLLQVDRSRLRPVALEVYDGLAARAVREAVPGLPAGAALAVVGIEGSRPVFERHMRELGPGEDQPRSSRAILDGSTTDRLWAAVRDLRAVGDASLVVRVAARPHDLPALLAWLSFPRLGALGATIQVGTGIARVWLPADELNASAAQLLPLQAPARESGGYLIVESAPLAAPGRARLPLRANAGTQPLVDRLRQAWDPERLLNPGRMPA